MKKNPNIYEEFQHICALLFSPLFSSSNPFFLLNQDYSPWWCNSNSKICLISRSISHDVFSISHFKAPARGYLRQLDILGSWHEKGTNLFFSIFEKSYPYYFTNRVKMKEYLLDICPFIFYFPNYFAPKRPAGLHRTLHWTNPDCLS